MHIQDVLPRDAIPSIDGPSFGSEYFGDADDDVIVVESDPPRAYPIRILSYHEIVNDVLSGETATETGGGERPDAESADRRPIAVTWCPICASAAAYDRTIDGRELTFGTSGALADDALVMYDRETGSEWKQPLGTAIGGPLEGRELTVVPAPVLSFRRFRSTYPDGIVLQPVHEGTGDRRTGSPTHHYDMTPYDRYDASAAFGLRGMRGEGKERSWDRNDINAKTTVLGIVHDGDAVGYPVPQVRAEGGIITDTVGGLDIVVVGWEAEIAAFEDPGYDFQIRNGMLYASGTSWDPATGKSSDGPRLVSVSSRRLYAFAWQDDHGRRSFYGLD